MIFNVITVKNMGIFREIVQRNLIIEIIIETDMEVEGEVSGTIEEEIGMLTRITIIEERIQILMTEEEKFEKIIEILTMIEIETGTETTIEIDIKEETEMIEDRKIEDQEETMTAITMIVRKKTEKILIIMSMKKTKILPTRGKKNKKKPRSRQMVQSRRRMITIRKKRIKSRKENQKWKQNKLKINSIIMFD